MKKKLFIALLSLVCTLTCTGFVACSNGGDSKTDNPTDSHTHSWSAVWESVQTATVFAVKSNPQKYIITYGRKVGKTTKRTTGTNVRQAAVILRTTRKKTVTPRTALKTATAFAVSRALYFLIG